MSVPQRIQLSRKAGWRMPSNTVKVDRTTKWGNPWRPVDRSPEATKAAVRQYRKFWRCSQTKLVEMAPDPLAGLKLCLVRTQLRKELVELRGKNLACWCKPDAPCHADVLLELANRPLANLNAATSTPSIEQTK